MLKLWQIADEMGARYDGDGSIELIGPAEPKYAKKNQVALALTDKYIEELKYGNAVTAIISEGKEWKDLPLRGVIFAPLPRYAMSQVSKVFFQDDLFCSGIHESSVVESEICSDNVSIGPFSVIGKGVKIGHGSRIGSNCFLANNVNIGKNARIKHGVTIGKNVSIGNNFISEPNSVIGSDGFSYVSPNHKDVVDARKTRSTNILGQIDSYQKIESLGSVFIGDNVEIGACVTIDSGSVQNTIIGDGTKIDNLVHIAHNVKIGKNCLICGQVGIAGSTSIGDRVVMAGQVGVGDNLTIGSDVIIAGKSGVSSNVPPNRFMMGNPAMKMQQSVESYKALRRLPRIEKRLRSFLDKNK